jgi:hypothetical protein
MALIFQIDDTGKPTPKIACDACGKVMEDHSGGVAIFDSQSAKSGTVIKPTFQCEGCQKKAGAPRPNSIPIDDFMFYLLNNIQLTPNVLEEAGRRLGERAGY